MTAMLRGNFPGHLRTTGSAAIPRTRFVNLLQNAGQVTRRMKKLMERRAQEPRDRKGEPVGGNSCQPKKAFEACLKSPSAC